MNFPELAEIEGKLENRRKKLADIFAEAGPSIDMTKVKSIDGDSAAKVEAVRTLNAEIDDFAKQAEPLRMLKATAEGIAKGADHKYTEVGDGATEGGAESGAGRKATPVSFGDANFGSDASKLKGQKVEIADFATVDALKTVFTTSAGWAPFTQLYPRVVDFATRPAMGLIDIMPTAPINAAALTYYEETTFTNAAVETSENAAKPEATLAMTARTATVRKVAVFLPVTDEQLEDVPAAKAYLDQRLGFMVRQRVSGQILVGDGSAPNVRGVLNTSGIQTQAKGTDPVPDAVYKAMTLVRVTGQAEPDAVVFNPTDWQDVRLLRTADGLYIWGNPSDSGVDRIWGLPVILDQAETLNTAVVGAWQQYSTLFVRSGLVVETGYNADDWTKNKQTIRAEMRLVPVFWRPAAFCTVTGV